jgi:hypothetical protein
LAYKIGTITNANGQTAYKNLLYLIRLLCGGFGDIGTVGGSRVGTGTLNNFEASPLSVTETWTLTCTSAAVDGGTFSVTGSVSGAQASATVGTPYSNTFVSFTIADGATDFQVGDSFTVPVTQGQLAAAGTEWEIMRYDNTSANHELIMKAPGLSGTEEIFIGIKTYESVPSDYYNYAIGTFTGYVPQNTFETQPNAKIQGCPAHNNAITYFISVNGQRIAACLKVGTPVYEHFYAGKILPYAKPGEYPYPMLNAAMLRTASATRFSDIYHQFPYHGYDLNQSYNAMMLRNPSATYEYLWAHPWCARNTDGGNWILHSSQNAMVPVGDNYQLEPIILGARSILGLWGEIDGIYAISGFNNGVENVMQIGGSSTIDQTGMTVLEAVDAIRAVGGRALVVLQNVNRTTFRDYVAMEMN